MRATTSVVSADLPPLDPRARTEELPPLGPRPERGPGLPPLSQAPPASALPPLGGTAAAPRAARASGRAGAPARPPRAAWEGPARGPRGRTARRRRRRRPLGRPDHWRRLPAVRHRGGRDRLDAPVVHHELRPGRPVERGRPRLPDSGAGADRRGEPGERGHPRALGPDRDQPARGPRRHVRHDPDGRRAPGGGRHREGRRPPGPGRPAPADPGGGRRRAGRRSPTVACASARRCSRSGAPSASRAPSRPAS